MSLIVVLELVIGTNFPIRYYIPVKVTEMIKVELKDIIRWCRRVSTVFLALLLAPSIQLEAQKITDPSQLPKDSFHWTQEQRELGFLYFDEVFGARDVPAGGNIRVLPEGAPISAFTDGGSKKQMLEDFLTQQKVAGLLVLQNGKIRLERYDLGLSTAGRWTSQSVAKSVTSTLVGVAIKEGYIKSVDDYLTEYIPDLKGSAYDSVTVHHLLSMSTGVKWNESYADGGDSDLMNFYITPVDPGINATVSYMRKLPSVAKPGEKWNYNTGETHLIGVLLNEATGKNLSEYLSSKIWEPYGMEYKASWNTGRSDLELAGCCLQMRLRDAARFGQFMLEGAKIDGESILPDDWFDLATKKVMTIWGPMGYGYQWWTYSDGTYQAIGIHGQMIHIDPARGLVVAVSSAWPEAENSMRSMALSNFLYSIAYEIDNE